MSDTPHGPGWWQASDGKWYQPELHPDHHRTQVSTLPPPGPSLPPSTQTSIQPFDNHLLTGPTGTTKSRKPVYKRWWFIALVAFFGLVGVSAALSSSEEDPDAAAVEINEQAQNDQAAASSIPAPTDGVVGTEPVVDVTQPVVAETQPQPVETQPAMVTTPPAPESNLTPSQQAAVRSAESYLDFMSFSRQGLIDQLSSEYGDQYPVEDATIAVDSLNVDWNAEAVESATTYLDLMGFSRQGLIDQLSSEFGEQFTVEQATYAVDSLNVDWNAEAVESATAYLDLMGFSCQGLIDQLSSEHGDQYTRDQATYAATQVGLC